MQIVFEMDYNDYNLEWQKEIRLASRAIIIKNNKLALIKSKKYGEYKCPGGGLKSGESFFDALVREVKEETGLVIIEDSIKEFGVIMEKRKFFGYQKILIQTSFYYECMIFDYMESTSLDKFEMNYGYELVWENPLVAIKANTENIDNPATPWAERELKLLSLIVSKVRNIG